MNTPDAETRRRGGGRRRPESADASASGAMDGHARPRITAVAGAALAALLAAGSARAETNAPAGGDVTALRSMSLEELMNVEVTSVSRRQGTIAESPAAVYVLTAEDIRRAGATSLPEALRLVPGLQVAQQDSSTWTVSARGFSSSANKLLVQIDGRSVYTPLYSGVFWDVQDTLLEDIDRIEVIRGPAGALWGANAVNGIVNIITKGAKETQGLLVTGGGGTEERAFGGMRYGWRTGDDAYSRVYVKSFERDDTALADGSDAGDAWRMLQGGFRTDWDPSPDNRFTLQGDGYGGDSNTPTNGTTSLSGGNVLGRWTRQLARGGDFQLQAYYDHTERTIRQVFGEKRDTFDVDFQHHFALGTRQDVTWGAGYRATRDNVDNSLLVQFDPDHRTTQVPGAFLQDEITLVEDRLRLTLGAKFAHDDYSGFEVQPGARLLWKIDRRQDAWTAVSRAVRTPTRLDSDLRINTVLPGGTNYISYVGSDEFESEEVIAYELGYRTRPLDRLALDAAAFFNVYDRLQSIEPGVPFTEQTPPPPHLVLPFAVGNKLEGETYGAELAATWEAADWWTLRGGYTHLREFFHTESGSTDTTSEDAEGDDPRNQAFVRSSMNLSHRLQVDAALRYVDSLPGQQVPSYLEGDARIAWSPVKRLELAVVGQNLFDRRHPEFGTDPALRSEIQREVYVSATCRW